MTRVDITTTERTTDYLDFQLVSDSDDDGTPDTGINLSAVDHIELWRRDKRGTIDSFSSAGAQVVITGSAAGSVQFRPGSADLIASVSPYMCQWKVFVTASRWYYVPEDTEFAIRVKPRIG